MSVFHRKGSPLRVDRHRDILIIIFYILHLRRRLSVPAVHNAVAAELKVCRTLSEIPAVSLKGLSVPVLSGDGLVDIVPDKTALVQGFLLRQIRILFHPAAGISHGVSILAADKGLIPVRREEIPDLLRRRVHSALHVGGFIISPVIVDPLVMNRTFIVQLAEFLRHLIDHPAAVRFIPAGPDQNRRMVFIPLVTGYHPVQHISKPFRFISGQRRILPGLSLQDRIPASVGFQIVFRDHIEPVSVTEFIERGTVGVVAGAHCVDIMSFHGQNVRQRILVRDHPSAFTAKFMPVHPLEHDPLSVQIHDAVPDLKTPEADILQDHLLQCQIFVVDLDQKPVQIRHLRAPELRLPDA